jgi:hypothetical protein
MNCLIWVRTGIDYGLLWTQKLISRETKPLLASQEGLTLKMTVRSAFTEQILQRFRPNWLCPKAWNTAPDSRLRCTARETAVVVLHDAGQSNGANLINSMGMNGTLHHAAVEWGKKRQCSEASIRRPAEWGIDSEACLCYADTVKVAAPQRCMT